jgi:hypothetical protein
MSIKQNILFLLLLLSVFGNQLIAQNTNGIFFQAVARDNYSNPAKDRKIYVQSSIVQTTATGTKVLTEEHQANTDASGVFSISLGNGLRVGGTASNLTNIDWSKGPFYLNLKVAITPIGGTNAWDYTKEWVDMGTTSFGAVPFALYSANAGGLDQKLSITDTTRMLAPYSKMVNALVASNITSLTAAYVNSALNSKVNLVDSGLLYITPSMLAAKTFDQTPINTAIASKLNIADSLNYVTPSQLAAKTFDTTSLSNRINLKAPNLDLINLTTKVNSNTASITSNTSAINSNTASITANTNSILSNTASLTANFNSINSNTASITSNTNAINSNTASITANTNSILSNTASITSNTSAINSNTASITANTTAIGLKLDANKVGVANGVASLNLYGLIPNNQIPAISFQSATVVTGQPAMLALNNAVVGSIAIRTDNSKNFVLSALPASTIGNWIELVSPASVTSVNGNAGPTVNLAAADIPNAESLLNKTTATDLGNTNPSDVLYPSQKAVKAYVDQQSANAGVADNSITTAKISGAITINKGGTGATNAADARTNLGLVIGTNVQAPLTAGTDYLTPTGSAANLTNFPTLNQNTTGNAATATLATNATYATTAGDITSTSNTTLTSLSNLNTVGTITTGTISLTTNIKTTNTLTTGAVTYPNIHGSNGQVLSTTGSGTLTWTTVSTTADAATLSGTIAINKGGTGASSKSAAFDALSPMTTSGDIIYGGLSGTGTRLGKGNNFSFLTLDDLGLPTWTNAIRATSGSTYNAAVGFSFIGGDWAKNTGMFSDNPDVGDALLKFRITGNSKFTIDANKVEVLTTTASTSKTTGALTVAGGLGVSGNLFATNMNASGTLTAGTVTYPSTHGSANQVLSTTGSGTLTWSSAPSINANLNDQTGTTYTLQASDNGKVVTLSNASAITLTVPSGLDAGFNCMIVQKGAGLVTLVGAGGVTVTNRIGFTKTGGTNAIVTLIAIASNYFVSGGDMQ